MNVVTTKLCRLVWVGPESCYVDLKRRLDDLKQEAIIDMGKLETSNMDFDIRKRHTAATNALVSN